MNIKVAKKIAVKVTGARWISPKGVKFEMVQPTEGFGSTLMPLVHSPEGLGLMRIDIRPRKLVRVKGGR